MRLITLLNHSSVSVNKRPNLNTITDKRININEPIMLIILLELNSLANINKDTIVEIKPTNNNIKPANVLRNASKFIYILIL